jgi:hypothetical protein
MIEVDYVVNGALKSGPVAGTIEDKLSFRGSVYSFKTPILGYVK